MELAQLRGENQELHLRLEEAEETIRAIQHGAVDAFVVQEEAGHRVYTLEAADRPYRLFVEQMQQGAATVHADGVIAYCNQRLADLLKTPHEKLVGARLNDFVVAEDLSEYENLLRQGESQSSRGETLLRQANGELVPAYLTFNALPKEFGALIGVLVTDLTAQRHHERLATALERVRISEEWLQAADRRKDEFLATLAHELRGPLAPLSNMLQILKHSDPDTERPKQALGTMERQLDQMVRLVDDLLDVSRITRNNLALRKETVELASIMRQSVEVCRSLADGAHHALTVRMPSEAIYLHADPVRLTQVFNNLLGNACKYTEPGGRIDVTVRRDGNCVVVAVKDTGLGIPPEKLDSVFDMFMQVDQSLERARGGLGIGLTLAKRLVEMHDGTLEAFSEGLGHGSEFVVKLPILVEAPRADISTEPKVEEGAKSTHRILIVDDNADSAASLAMLLNLTGNETQIANDGLEAVAAAEQFHPEVVLLDIGLPKLNGFEVARRIRSQLWGKEMVLVALTGWGQEEDRRKSKDAGFDAHMVKPVDYDTLMKLLN